MKLEEVSQRSESAGSDALEQTVPQVQGAGLSGFTPIDPYDEEEIVGDGLEHEVQEPPELVGKSREELYAQLQAQQEALKLEQQKTEPISALGATLREILGQKPQQTEIQPGYLQTRPVGGSGPTETPEQREQRLNDLYLSNPVRAQQELQKERDQAFIEAVGQNQAQLSRELALTNPQTKAVYDKYGQEIESEIARMNPWERFQNPRMYQDAVNRIRARHQDDFVQEAVNQKIEEIVNQRLKDLGIDPQTVKPGQPVQAAAARPTPAAVSFTPAGSQMAAGAGRAPTRRQIDPPLWIRQEADRIGVDAKFLYHHYQEKGLVR